MVDYPGAPHSRNILDIHRTGTDFQRKSRLSRKVVLRNSSPLLPLHPCLASYVLVVSYSSQHPIILPGKHPVTSLIIRFEHLRLLHAGTTLLACSLSRRYYIIGGRKTIRSVTRSCITCRRTSVKPQDQMLGQLPMERVTPDLISLTKLAWTTLAPFSLNLDM